MLNETKQPLRLPPDREKILKTHVRTEAKPPIPIPRPIPPLFWPRDCLRPKMRPPSRSRGRIFGLKTKPKRLFSRTRPKFRSRDRSGLTSFSAQNVWFDSRVEDVTGCPEGRTLVVRQTGRTVDRQHEVLFVVPAEQRR